MSTLGLKLKPIRPIRIEGNMAYVPLTKGYEAVIDAADVPLVEGNNWWADVKPRHVYAARKESGTSGRARTILMHRLIAGEPSGLEVDHRDGNGLNNKRSNLRPATTAQNQQNQRLSIVNTSGFKGVSWHKSKRCFVARIKVAGRLLNLGQFGCAEDAGAAYASASSKYHREFGRTA